MTVMGAVIYPSTLSMSFPVFLYLLVLEKEARLLEFMKINGLKMSNYWLINFLFDFFIYAIQITIYLIFAIKIFAL